MTVSSAQEFGHGTPSRVRLVKFKGHSIDWVFMDNGFQASEGADWQSYTMKATPTYRDCFGSTARFKLPAAVMVQV
jgi:hypothetical protein